MILYDLKDTLNVRADFKLAIEACRIEPGVVYAVTGPNGSGKSTFLKLLAFIERPSKGSVIFNGRAVNYDSPNELLRLRRRTGCLLQNPYLFNMSVYDNIGYGLKVRGTSDSDISKKVARIMDELSLVHLAGRGAHTLSGGEAQRVALARALVLDVDVFLLDEPTVNVDQAHVRVVEELIIRLNRDRKVTVIVATHSLDQVYRMSRNIITVMNGRISDIGYANVFSGVLNEDADGLKRVRLDIKTEIRVAEGQPGPATVAIDPQAIILSDYELMSSALNRLRGTIVKIEEAGGSVRVFMDTGIILCALITRKSYHDMNLNIGKSVWLTFKASAVRVLD